MNLLRNKGLDLPTFDNDTEIAWTATEMEAQSRLGMSSFVRAVKLERVKRLKLPEILTVADQQFVRAAELCGAVVVGHSWGLYCKSKQPSPAEQAIYREYYQDGMPPSGHVLVSQVSTIRDIQPFTTRQTGQIINGLNTYEASQNDPYRWSDAGHNQFVSGTSSGHRGLILADIDPLIDAR